MDLLDELLAVEIPKETPQEKERRQSLEEGHKLKGKNSQDSEDNGSWLMNSMNSMNSSSSSMTSSLSKSNNNIIHLRETRMKPCVLSDLIWAPNSSFKGGCLGHAMPARKATQAEVVTDTHIKFPIAKNNIIVEFFGLVDNDRSYWRYMIVPLKEIRPFNVPKKNRSGKLQMSLKDTFKSSTKKNDSVNDCNGTKRDKWDLNSVLDMEEALKIKLSNTAEAGRVHRHTMKIAEAFLDQAYRALESENNELDISESDIQADEDYKERTSNNNNNYDDDDLKIEDLIDNNNDSPLEELTLEAGMYIGHEEKQLRNKLISRILEITNHHKAPLILDTNTVVNMNEIIQLYKNDNNGGYHKEQILGSRKLRDFKLVLSKIDAENSTAAIKRAARSGNAALARSTGLQINRKRKSLSSDAPLPPSPFAEASQNE